MKKTFALPQHRILIRWIVTGSIILLIPVICSLLSFQLNKHILERKIGQVNNMILREIQQNIDERLNDIINVAQHIYIDPDFSISKLSEQDNVIFHSRIDTCFNKLQIYRSANSEIHVCIYISAKDFLLTESTANQFHCLYNTLRQSRAIQYSIDEWRARIMENPSHSLLISDDLIYRDYGKEKLIYIMRDMSVSSGRVIMVSISPEFIDNVLTSETNQNYSLLLADGNGNIIANYGADILPAGSSVTLSGLKEYEPFSLNGQEEYIASYVDSGVCDWTYVICAPKADYMTEIRSNTAINMLIISLGLIIGIVSMTILQRYNYRPIRHMADSIPSTDSRANMDEFAWLGQRLRNLYQENSSMRNSLDHKNQREKEWYFLARLKGYKSYVLDTDLCGLIGCEERSSRFLLAIINAGTGAAQNSQFQNDFPLLVFSVKNVLEELIEGSCQYLQTMDGTLIVYLFAVPKSENWNSWFKNCTEKTEMLRLFFQDWFQTELTVSLGERFESISGISSNYTALLEQARHRTPPASEPTDEQTGRQKELGNRIREYVIQNYTDSNMNISTIAQEFQLSSRYISGIFKEQQGMGLIDYINNVRISQAEILLQNTPMTVDEIAEITGYTNSRTFRRNFQKITGRNAASYKRKY